MRFYLGLIVYITPLSLANQKCAPNQYYDGLTERCEPCMFRCSSPPSVCTAYCRPTKSEPPDLSETSESPSYNLRVILVALLVFLGVFMVVSLILQFLRRRTCKSLSKTKVPCQEEAGPTVLQEALDIQGMEENLAGLGQIHQEEQSEVLPNSSLPLPSTEEGTTVLVTTKTGQSDCCRAQNTDNMALYLWRPGFVP
ncbi:tumor necrosis factor receptor superfamily member 17 [Clupea harengus]|uniref:Tumor necrosis factor receptor superfamily member 17 n=1 Tax=Clupea harengus TaxID=7950 RepID=A0A6P8F1V8_CLUHA|nr:tumor necrosis factor receptor superfamily member 17 [Clupea harengus]